MTVPDFLVIGAQKSATTALYEYLRRHPEVFVPTVKEPHYFCSPAAGVLPAWEPRLLETLRHILVTTQSEYTSLFDGAAGRLTGECSTGYLHDPAVPHRVAAANPNVRVVAILRDPVERAYSAWWMYRSAHLNPYGFERALSAEDRRLSSGWGLPFAYRGNSCYATHLARWRDTVGPAQLLVLRQDGLVHRRDIVLDELFDFLGVSRLSAPAEETIVNEARPRGPRPGVRRLVAGFEPLYPVIRRIAPHGLIETTKRVVLHSHTRPQLTAAVADRLRRQLRDQVERLEADLGWDLSDWKSDST